jgi:hypothetical protein
MRSLALLKIPVAAALEGKSLPVEEKLAVFDPELAEAETLVVCIE